MFGSLLVSVSIIALLDSVSSQIGVTSTSLSSFASGVDGVRIIGGANSQAGFSIAQIGDHNNDGIVDFAVGSPSAEVNSIMGCGLTVIVLGSSGDWTDIDLTVVASGNTLRRIYSAEPYTTSGSSVGGAGDVNDDGFDDILIGAGTASPGSTIQGGAIYVIFGAAPPYTDVILSVSFIAGSVGYAIFGSIDNGQIGGRPSNTRGLGDINGDGIDDFAISAQYYQYGSRDSAGCVWIVYGTTATPVNLNLQSLGSAGILIGGATVGDNAGSSIDGADVNGDGINDLLIGAFSYSPVVGGVTRQYAGVVYLIYGSSTLADLDLLSFVTGAAGVRYLGGVAIDGTGWGVSGAGDVNGDGIADMLMGASTASFGSLSFAGKVYVVFGSSTVHSADVDLLSFTAGAAGYSVFATADYDMLGYSASRAGDINSDGVDDFVVSAPGGSLAVIIYGSTVVPTADVNLATATDVYTITGVSGGQLGYSCDGGKDLTGEGYPDILLGAPTDSVTVAGGFALRSSAGVGYMLKGPLPRSGTFAPTIQPTFTVTAVPTAPPSAESTSPPTADPSTQPSGQPTSHPSTQPTSTPSGEPSSQPSSEPTTQPVAAPSAVPSAIPTAVPSTVPTAAPSTAAPSAEVRAASDGSRTATLTNGGIAGVVVGAVFLLMLVIVIALFFVAAQGAAAAASTYEMTAVQQV